MSRDIEPVQAMIKHQDCQFSRAIGVAWLLGVLCLFLFYPPYWALMDDHGHLINAVNHFGGLNLFQYVAHFVDGDRDWGMFRPMYAVFIYVFYGIFKSSSQLGYLFICVFNFSIFWIWALLFGRCLVIFSQDLKKNQLYFFRWLFLIFCFLFSRNYTLFFFASLQERLLLFFGSLAFLGMIRMIEMKKMTIWYLSAVLIGVILALLSKATALFFYSTFHFGKTEKHHFVLKL